MKWWYLHGVDNTSVQSDETANLMVFSVKKDLQLMGFTARKKSLTHLYLLLDNKEFALSVEQWSF